MKKITTIRHGQSMGNEWEYAYHDDNINFLTLEGINQSIRCGEYLKEHNYHFDFVISSNLTRTKQTTSIILQRLGDSYWKKITSFECFDELNERSHMQTFEFNSKGQWKPKKNWEKVESKSVHSRRVWDFANYFKEDILPKYNNILLVSHGLTMNELLIECFPDFNQEYQYPFRILNTEIIDVYWDGENFSHDHVRNVTKEPNENFIYQ